jgi:hypothetical protein
VSETSVHVIPVPPGWSPEQSWEHISRSKRLPTDYPDSEQRWVSVVIEGFTSEGAFVTGGRLVEWVER